MIVLFEQHYLLLHLYHHLQGVVCKTKSFFIQLILHMIELVTQFNIDWSIAKIKKNKLYDYFALEVGNNISQGVSMNFIICKPQSLPFGWIGILFGYKMSKSMKYQSKGKLKAISWNNTMSNARNCNNNVDNYYILHLVISWTIHKFELTFWLTIFMAMIWFYFKVDKESQISTVLSFIFIITKY